MKCGFLSEASTSTPEWGSCADGAIKKENDKVKFMGRFEEKISSITTKKHGGETEKA